jgi:GNAT superfamily N-acetyltransferase
MRIDDQWAERATLDDGRPVDLRMVRPSDRETIARGFARLSERSRYARFLSARAALTPRELDYLVSDLDGDRHLALGAIDPASGEGLGIARFVRLAESPEVAEAAVTVADEAQGKGLGRLLLARLVEAARERGVRSFRADVLAANEPMRALLADVPEAVCRPRGEVVEVELPLDELHPAAPPETRRKSPLYRLLTAAARGQLLVERALAWLTGHRDQ